MGTATKKKRKPAGNLKSLTGRARARNRTRVMDTLSEAETKDYCKRWIDWSNYTPKRMLVLRRIIMQAWDMVCYMTDAGLKLRSSSLEEAALTIAGSAFAGYRYACEDNPHLQAEAPVEILDGFCEGIMWAMWNGDGMPSGMAETYTHFAKTSESVLDRMIPLQVVENLFPEMVKNGKLTLERVEVAPLDPDAWDALRWTHSPNILTTSVVEVEASLERDSRRDRARRQKAQVAKKSKAKPRAK
jgi:hypothetical protein